MNDEFEEVLVKPPDICEAAENASLYLLPAKSRSLYERCYRTYTEWKKSSQTTSTSERVLMAYFHSLAKNYQPSTLWSYYSMLKTTIIINEKLDISTYHKLTAFLKEQSHGFRSKKSKIFSSEEVKKFLTEAPDDKYLLTKVVLIFGIAGSCRKDELTNIKLQDLETHGDLLLVKIPNNKTSKPRSFTIGDQLYAIVKKYQNLRPPNATTDRFFLNIRNGTCTVQVVGKNRFGTVPKEIATYLNLPNADQYTGHCFRRTSATVLAGLGDNITTLKCYGGWKSSTLDIEESIRNKSKRRTAISSAINLRTSTSSDSDQDSQDPLAKKIKVELIGEDDVEVNGGTSEQIENVGNQRVFHVQNCANVTINYGGKSFLAIINLI